MRTIGIVDYKMGNLFSVEKALELLEVKPVILSSPDMIANCDALVLPGVGAFKEAMASLDELGFTSVLKQWINDGKPFLGICLGMQLLLDSSEEFGVTDGLGIIRGSVLKIPTEINEQKVKVPHVGWEEINHSAKNHPALNGIDDKSDMYFVHSYHAKINSPTDELTHSYYQGFRFTSSIAKGNVWAFQFHPEKSGKLGLKLLKNWISIVN